LFLLRPRILAYHHVCGLLRHRRTLAPAACAASCASGLSRPACRGAVITMVIPSSAFYRFLRDRPSETPRRHHDSTIPRCHPREPLRTPRLRDVGLRPLSTAIFLRLSAILRASAFRARSPWGGGVGGWGGRRSADVPDGQSTRYRHISRWSGPLSCSIICLWLVGTEGPSSRSAGVEVGDHLAGPLLCVLAAGMLRHASSRPASFKVSSTRSPSSRSGARVVRLR